MLDKPLNILLIEDSKTDALLISKALMQALPYGSKVTTAATLALSIPLITEVSYDVALLDLMLPDTLIYSGLQTVQNMTPNLPIVILTSHAEEDMAFGAIERGAQDYLYKNEMNPAILKRVMNYAMGRKAFEGQLITRANFDPLTGLANRILFESRLDVALARHKRTHENICVFFLDLNRFKQVNDTYGHKSGDAVLQITAERLRTSLRPYDTVARFGGDEFALLIEGLPAISHCDAIAEKVSQTLCKPCHVGDKIMDIGVSIGIATCTKEGSYSRAEIMNQADEAMYAAKLDGQNNIHFFTPLQKNATA